LTVLSYSISPNLQKKRLNPHLFVTLPPVNPGYISRSAVSAFFAPLLRAHEEKPRKKTPLGLVVELR
jgi:hypothetical protein